MRKTLIIIALIFSNSSGFASPLEIGKKWPVFWKQFKSQPEEQFKKYITVRFSESLNDSCEILQKNSNNQALAEQNWWYEKDTLKERAYGMPFSSVDEFKKNYKWLEKTYVEPLMKKLINSSYLRTSSAVEVLRQSGYSDWKLYSRYNFEGVGDLAREALEKGVYDSEKTKKYLTGNAFKEAKEICETYGYKIKKFYSPTFDFLNK